ncbi:MAG: tetratricopeptide repeat protein [Armatimonadetes bacterium]|nr:tetratricopeptide repeat protein [Armatimonadota bacterium]
MSVAHIALDPLAEAVQLHCSGQTEAAEALYRSVLEHTPNRPRAAQYLGVLLFQGNRRQEGLALLRRSVEVNPGDAEGWSNLGNALRVTEDRGGAIQALQKAIELDPRNAAAYCTLSACLRHPGSLIASIEAARAAVRLQPQMPQAHCNLGLALLDLGDVKAAVSAFEQARYIAPQFVEALQGLLFAAHYSERHSAADICSIAREFELLSQRQAGFSRIGVSVVGFVSGDFKQHPVAYFLEPLLRGLADRDIKAILYSSSTKSDSWTDRLIAAGGELVSIADMGTPQVLQQIRDDGVDVLIDLAGHTANNRWDIFANRAAPVQASWLGYSGTTGLPNMDLLLADEATVPSGDERFYTEAVVRLPQSLFCFDPARLPSPSGNLPSVAKGHVTFGSFNNVSKLSPKTVALWSQVLTAVPESVMRVKSFHLSEQGVADRLLRLFAQNGVSSDRIEVRGWTPEGAQFADYNEVDIALDSHPYSGATTTIEALAMGVPVVSLTGDRYASRMSHSLMTAVGRGEWSCETDEQFVDTAVSLASDPVALTQIRSSLRGEVEASPLCDHEAYTEAFLSALVGGKEMRKGA